MHGAPVFLPLWVRFRPQPLKEKTIPLIVPTEKYAIFIQSAKNSM
jgi:hypothetical protein